MLLILIILVVLFDDDILYVLCVMGLIAVLLIVMRNNVKRAELFANDANDANAIMSAKAALQDSFVSLANQLSTGNKKGNAKKKSKSSNERTIVLSNNMFQMYKDVPPQMQTQIMEKFPIDNEDPSFKPDMNDPYYTSKLDSLIEEYSVINEYLDYVEEEDPVKHAAIISKYIRQ